MSDSRKLRRGRAGVERLVKDQIRQPGLKEREASSTLTSAEVSPVSAPEAGGGATTTDRANTTGGLSTAEVNDKSDVVCTLPTGEGNGSGGSTGSSSAGETGSTPGGTSAAGSAGGLVITPAPTDSLVWPAIANAMTSFRAGLDDVFRRYQVMQDLLEPIPAPEQRSLLDQLQGQLSLGQIESTKQRAIDMIAAATAVARGGDALGLRLSPLFLQPLGAFTSGSRSPAFAAEVSRVEPRLTVASVQIDDLEAALAPYLQEIAAAGKNAHLLRFDAQGNPYMIEDTSDSELQISAAGSTKGGSAPAAELGGTKNNPPPTPNVDINFDFDALRDAIDALSSEAEALKVSLEAMQATLDLIQAELAQMIADAAALHGVAVPALNNTFGGTTAGGIQALTDAQAHFADLRTWLTNLKAQADVAKAAVTHALTTLQSLVTLIQELRVLLDNRPSLTSGDFAAWASAVNAKIAEIEAAKASLDLAIPAARAELEALFTLLETGLQETINRLTAGLAKIRDAVNAFNAWLQEAWRQFKAAVEALQIRRDELMTPLFSQLDFRMTRVKCVDKQDPWTQSNRDEVLMAHMAIGSTGVIHQGTRYLGTFHPNGSGGHPAERTFSGGTSTLHQFGVPGSSRVANAYVMIVALYERDWDDEFAGQWASLASWLSSDLQSRLQNLHNPDARAEVLGKLKDWVMERVSSRIFGWADEEVLGVKIYPVMQWYPSMAFDRPSRTQIMSGLHWHIVTNPGVQSQLEAMSDDALLRYAIAQGVFFPALRQKRYTDIFTNSGKVGSDRVGRYEVDVWWDFH